MEDIFIYKDEYGNECTFLREKYYKHVCAVITDFFEEPLSIFFSIAACWGLTFYNR
jgi:hypothetical protein